MNVQKGEFRLFLSIFTKVEMTRWRLRTRGYGALHNLFLSRYAPSSNNYAGILQDLFLTLRLLYRLNTELLKLQTVKRRALAGHKCDEVPFMFAYL